MEIRAVPSFFLRFCRHHRKLLLAFCSGFLFVALLLNYTNLGDVLSYSLSDTYAFPLSIHCNAGRLGNQMCTYATLYGLSALNNRRPFVGLSCNTVHLQDYFDKLSVQRIIDPYAFLKWNTWTLLPYLKEEDAAIPKKINYMAGYLYPCSYTFFDHVREEIRKEFRFRGHLQEHARTVLEKANPMKWKNATYVGIHVRRGDYQKRWLDVFEGVPVNLQYFQEAVSYFREKYNRVIFVAVSNDRLWCIQNLVNRFGVYVAEDSPTPGHDLSVLATCNHTIMTYGTFGFWGAYLAGGETIYFDKFLKPNTEFTSKKFIFDKMYLPEWKGLVTVNVSQWDSENSTTIEKEDRNSTSFQKVKLTEVTTVLP